nr:MAG TPA: hypothetical protein [Caudoviricetes sp.]
MAVSCACKQVLPTPECGFRISPSPPSFRPRPPGRRRGPHPHP